MKSKRDGCDISARKIDIHEVHLINVLKMKWFPTINITYLFVALCFSVFLYFQKISLILHFQIFLKGICSLLLYLFTFMIIFKSSIEPITGSEPINNCFHKHLLHCWNWGNIWISNIEDIGIWRRFFSVIAWFFSLSR